MDVSKIRPLHADVLLKLKPHRERVSSLIYYEEPLSDTDLQSFYVVAVGLDVKSVVVGDVVLCSWKRITPPFDLEVDGVSGKYGITDEKEILAVIED